jgi:hypothetical protein
MQGKQGLIMIKTKIRQSRLVYFRRDGQFHPGMETVIKKKFSIGVMGVVSRGGLFIGLISPKIALLFPDISNRFR